MQRREHTSGPDVTRLWAGRATSQPGSVVAGVTLPVVVVSTPGASVTAVAVGLALDGADVLPGLRIAVDDLFS